MSGKANTTMATDKKSMNAQDPGMAAQPAPGVVAQPAATQPTPPVVGADGKVATPVAPGDDVPSIPNEASKGQGTTQEDADKAAGGNYRVLYPISYGGKDGGHQQARPGDIVFLSAEDAKGLLEAKAVESADTSGAEKKPGETDPRKIQ